MQRCAALLPQQPTATLSHRPFMLFLHDVTSAWNAAGILHSCHMTIASLLGLSGMHVVQDVIEISVESMRDIQGGTAGVSCIDFRPPAGTRAGSKQVCLICTVQECGLQMWVWMCSYVC